MTIKKTGTVGIKTKPCPECGGEMKYKNIRKEMCDVCKVRLREEKREARSVAEYQSQQRVTEWDNILERFKGRRTGKQWAECLMLAEG